MAKSKVQDRPSHLSNERVMDSSDEESNMVQRNRTAKKTAKSKPSANTPKTNGLGLTAKKSKGKPQTPESTSDAESSSASPAEDGPRGDDSDEESSEAESDDVSDGGSVDSQRETSSATNLTTSANKRKSGPESLTESRKKTKPNSVSKIRIAPTPFKAPQGYEPFALSASDYASQSTSLFENLSGKQIWHISAPASLSLQSITELDIQAALQGRCILSKTGTDYNMHPTPSQHEIILLPAGQDSTYEQTEVAITRSFDLREMSTMPLAKARDNEQGSTASIVFTATREGSQGQPRKQPEGLRQRYVPFGARDAHLGQAVGKSSATFQMPDDIVGEQSGDKATTLNPKKVQIDGGETSKKQRKDKARESPEKKKKRRRIVDEDVL